MSVGAAFGNLGFKVLNALDKAAQPFATERGIAVVLIHHDRKMEADDPFDTVSGSTGITGAADTILILKRTAAGVTLYARGRDIEEAELAVQFNRNICKWTILGQAVEVRRSDERSRVIAALKKADGPLSVKDLMAAADLGTRNAADVLLFKMAGEGEIVRVARGQYGLPGCSTTDGGPAERWSAAARYCAFISSAPHTSLSARSTNLDRVARGNALWATSPALPRAARAGDGEALLTASAAYKLRHHEKSVVR